MSNIVSLDAARYYAVFLVDTSEVFASLASETAHHQDFQGVLALDPEGAGSGVFGMTSYKLVDVIIVVFHIRFFNVHRLKTNVCSFLYKQERHVYLPFHMVLIQDRILCKYIVEHKQQQDEVRIFSTLQPLASISFLSHRMPCSRVSVWRY